MRHFTQSNPPKSGNAKRLWDWWIEQCDEAPKYLDVPRPGRNQKAAGVASYIITDELYRSFLVFDVKETLKMSPDMAWHNLATGDYNLA